MSENLVHSSHPPAILMFDDHKEFTDTWSGILRKEGYGVTVENDPRQVYKRVRDKCHDKCYDVILLDLVVDEGDNAGANVMIDEGDCVGVYVMIDIRTYSPASRVIVVTEAGAVEAVGICKDLGARDVVNKRFLEKQEGMDRFLAKIDQAARPSTHATVTETQREALIQLLWATVRRPEGYEPGRRLEPYEAGRRLEQLVKVLFESLPMVDKVRINQESTSEEIDLVIRHHSTDKPWVDYGPFLLCECKNWSSGGPPETKDFSIFAQKIVKRPRYCGLGFFVSMNGFSRGFQQELLAHNRANSENSLVVTLDEHKLRELVDKPSGFARQECLRELAFDATMGWPAHAL